MKTIDDVIAGLAQQEKAYRAVGYPERATEFESMIEIIKEQQELLNQAYKFTDSLYRH